MTQTLSELTDADLLADYVRDRSPAAFSQIVHRHIHMVHAAAWRQVGDPHLAQDITQTVFLLLWQRASSINRNTQLAGWLLLATRNVAMNAKKQEMRLKRRERQVAQMTSEPQPAQSPEANAILPLLDNAIAALDATDRDAIVGRFFHSQSLSEVGERIGLSGDAAAKRVSRALTKLRQMLERRGVTASEATLTALLPTIAFHPVAPTTLVSTVLTGSSAAASATVVSLLRAALHPPKMMFVPIAAVMAGIAVLGGVAYLAVISHRSPQAATPPAQVIPVVLPVPAAAPVDDRTVTLLLVDDKTNAPITNAKVEVDVNNNRESSQAVGSDGKFLLHLPPEFESVRVYCRATGRVAMGLSFEAYAFKGDSPREYTVPMQAGITVGGVVVDDAGKPLAGANIHLSQFFDGSASDAPGTRLNESATTDANGKWEINGVPKKMDRLYLEVAHPAYPRGSYANALDGSHVDELRRGVFKTAMQQHKGKDIDGVVLDSQDQPVEQAKVVVANDRYEQDKPTAMTDALGQFHVSNVMTRWQSFLTVTAEGFAPEQVPLPGDDDNPTQPKPKISPTLKIHMKEPSVLQGTVVDPNGTPIEGVRVEAENWRGNRALEWSTKTDADGHFIWRDAPADSLQINAFKDKSTVEYYEVTPGATSVKITLYPPVKISGTVVDADTKTPIPAFRIVYGNHSGGPDDVIWQTGSARKLANGKYSAEISQFFNGGKLRIEAEDYIPAISRMIQGSEGTITVNFELKKGHGPSGIVVNPDGKPMPNMRVACIPQGTGLYFDSDQDLSNRADVAMVDTDKDGHFQFQPQDKKYAFVVFDDEGFALVTGEQLAGDGKIKLQKWARIEGDYRRNASPAKSAVVGATPQWERSPTMGMIRMAARKATTDANGHFAIDRLPPCDQVSLDELVPLGEGSETYAQLAQVTTTSGQTTTVHLGGKGRPVVGKASIPAGMTEPVDYRMQLSFQPVQSGEDLRARYMKSIVFPDDFPDMTVEQQSQWGQNYMKAHPEVMKEEEEIQQSAGRLRLQFFPSKDGTFRADDVEPGNYKINVILRAPFVRFEGRAPDVIGYAVMTFTVPARPACPTDEALDVGSIQLNPPVTVGPGKPLPPVELVSADGKPIDQTAWAGKVVVLHVFQVHNRTFFPVVTQLADKFNGNANVIVMNVGVLMLPKWATHIAEHDHLGGSLALDKDSYNMDFSAVYQQEIWLLQPQTSVFLLDAHGQLIEQITDPQKLAAAVEAAVGK
jgi:RNA polymerase sigma factor (sigma-70 family)